MTRLIEPYRIKTVEPIRCTNEEERGKLIQDVNLDVSALRAEDVMIDLLTDSGTSAMSCNQYAAMEVADESYVNSRSYFRFIEAAKNIFPFKYILPTHQGRAAESLLAKALNSNKRVLSNGHFDTTRANFESNGLVTEDLCDYFLGEETTDHFLGNMSVSRLEQALKSSSGNIALVVLTVTNNRVGGQPVSMNNIRSVSKLCRSFGVPIFIDGCRYAENAFLIKEHEAEFHDASIEEIVKEFFSYADGMTMSAKKDPMVHIGGWIATNDDSLAKHIKNEMLVVEGFVTYGGLSGRDLEAMAVGIGESLNEDYLRYRIGSVKRLAKELHESGIPVVRPCGTHSVIINASNMLPHLTQQENPGQALNVALYIEGGLRTCDLGSTRLHSDQDEAAHVDIQSYVRLAIPRRVYSYDHMRYIVDVFTKVNNFASKVRGLIKVEEPCPLRHYASVFEYK